MGCGASAMEEPGRPQKKLNEMYQAADGEQREDVMDAHELRMAQCEAGYVCDEPGNMTTKLRRMVRQVKSRAELALAGIEFDPTMERRSDASSEMVKDILEWMSESTRDDESNEGEAGADATPPEAAGLVAMRPKRIMISATSTTSMLAGSVDVPCGRSPRTTVGSDMDRASTSGRLHSSQLTSGALRQHEIAASRCGPGSARRFATHRQALRDAALHNEACLSDVSAPCLTRRLSEELAHSAVALLPADDQGNIDSCGASEAASRDPCDRSPTAETLRLSSMSTITATSTPRRGRGAALPPLRDRGSISTSTTAMACTPTGLAPLGTPAQPAAAPVTTAPVACTHAASPRTLCASLHIRGFPDAPALSVAGTQQQLVHRTPEGSTLPSDSATTPIGFPLSASGAALTAVSQESSGLITQRSAASLHASFSSRASVSGMPTPSDTPAAVAVAATAAV